MNSMNNELSDLGYDNDLMISLIGRQNKCLLNVFDC